MGQGNVIGKANTPTTTVAKGVWSLREQHRARLLNSWPSAVEPYFNSVSALLHMDGANGGTSFVDSGPNNVTFTATNATTSTSQFKFGTASASFSGNGRLTASSSSLFNFSGTSFTVECWFRASNVTSGVRGIIGQRFDQVLSSGYYGQFILAQNGTQITWLSEKAGSPGSWAIVSSINANVVANTWYHLALVGNGSTQAVYLNGTSIATETQPAWQSSSRPLYIGWDADGGFVGNIDEVRITKGVARYTSNFTAPTEPF